MRLKQLAQLHTPLVSGRDMLMTPSPSTSHHMEELSWITSILLTSIYNFLVKNKEIDGSMPFLDILVMPTEDGSLSTTVHRKPTHTDLYLHWDSHHTLSSKYSVIGTLQHRAKTICSNPQLLKQEEDHLHRALTKCKYPAWALNRIKLQIKKSSSEEKH